jgi:hypothetical protein
MKGGEPVTLIDAAGHFPHHGDITRFIGLHHAEHASAAVEVDHGSPETKALNDWAYANPGKTPPPDLLHPHAAAAPSEPASTPGAHLERTPSTPEASVSAPVEQSTSFSSPQIGSLSESPVWGEYHGQDTWNLLKSTAAPGSATGSLRESVLDLTKSTGVGPRVGEPLEQYMARVDAAVASGTAAPSHVFKVGDYYIAHGGDLMARQTLALEYRRLHGTIALVANQNGFSVPSLQYPPGAATFTHGPDGTLPNQPPQNYGISIELDPKSVQYTNLVL